MEYKIVKPEDFTDVDLYAYKVIRAYSVLYLDFLTLLVYLDRLSEMVGVEYQNYDEIQDRIQEILKPFKIK